MPTWRHYLKFENEDSVTEFLDSKYFHVYNKLIHSPLLHKILEENGYKLFFYPHSDIQHYLSYFESLNENVIIADKDSYDVQKLLKDSALLITDYSSVFFDFAYMKKPCIYYQFDYEEFRKGHWKEGYFDYEKDSFGPIADNEQSLLFLLNSYFENNFYLEEEYIKKIEEFFEHTDQGNCKRVYEAVLDI